jgi:putative transposase
MTPTIRQRCIEIIQSIAPNFSVELLEAEGESDHLHLLISIAPHTTISRFVNSAKTVTSRRLKQERPELREQLWKEKFWSRSYFVASTGGSSLEKVREYIQTQGK